MTAGSQMYATAWVLRFLQETLLRLIIAPETERPPVLETSLAAKNVM